MTLKRLKKKKSNRTLCKSKEVKSRTGVRLRKTSLSVNEKIVIRCVSYYWKTKHEIKQAVGFLPYNQIDSLLQKEILKKEYEHGKKPERNRFKVRKEILKNYPKFLS